MPVNRPLSPHLQVYRLPLTGMISITHRITGVLLALGLLLFVYMLAAMAMGRDAYDSMQTFMAFGLCRGIYWGFVFALCFHLCHGIRHLIWDIGKTLDRASLTVYAMIELLATLALTATAYYLS